MAENSKIEITEEQKEQYLAFQDSVSNLPDGAYFQACVNYAIENFSMNESDAHDFVFDFGGVKNDD